MSLSKEEILRKHYSDMGKKGNPKRKGFAANPELARLASLKGVEAKRRKRELKNEANT